MSRELADLLGQVKPPTVSKDEIDKSGLEIIKAAQLSQHENDGKVSSNCLDRVGCFSRFQSENAWMLITTIYLGSVLYVWMIISPRTIFALCRVAMLSIKLALMSGYRLEGITVLLVGQRYVQKILFYNAYLSHDCFPSRLGRDDWHRQLHILISFIENQSFFVISFHEPKKPPSGILAMRFQSPFLTHLSPLILVPVVRFC